MAADTDRFQCIYIQTVGKTDVSNLCCNQIDKILKLPISGNTGNTSGIKLGHRAATTSYI